MFNHIYNFDIKIPEELISNVKHNSLIEDNLSNKIILGLCGYARSGKDSITKKFTNQYRFHRIAFADGVKRDMNNFLKESVLFDIRKKEDEEVEKLRNSGVLVDYQPTLLEEIDFFTEDVELKKKLRPYVIWFAEKLKEINGPYYWINKAFEIDAKGFDNIIISDVRRTPELDIFRNSNSFKKRLKLSLSLSGIYENNINSSLKSYSSLLFHVSQLNLEDPDELTQECIRIAQEQWLFDYTFLIDPRIPEYGKYRDNSINYQINDVVKKFGIKKPDKTISINQTKMF